ncbi:30S ribosomal protein S9 [Candidatus Woesearchaeota archaeon CG10_big_fil_rev_8_21_14_0_10_34_8]|nr:MAG: 30S ribosomal protein S9 [Candidatus Woesearchaeota archaeon CG10_big_fil_rev_8_21_14_0_10_34_8]
MTKIVQTSGKRKKAIAHATIKAGKGVVHINNKLLSTIGPSMIQLRLKEPLLIAGNIAQEVDVNVRVHGGGVSSQADAVRLAIARGLVAYTESNALKSTFLDYDRQLLVADVRQNEKAKPNSHGKARAKRQKSYR